MNRESAHLTQPASELDRLCINTIRFLAVDAVERAKSGHPGLPMGSAAMAYVLWDRFLKFNPRNSLWADRDRYVLSAGHGCMLLYSLLHLTGFPLSLDDIKNFRQYGSITPGHPEYGKTPGVEATTGPLGQGLANAVGMAIAEEALASRFNRPGHTIVDHHVYVEASDGDLMEGVSSEAASLAGHLGLGKLIVFYDDNHISIEGSTDLAFTEDRAARFAAYGWHVQKVEDGNDLAETAKAVVAARAETSRPSFIAVRTHLGYGSPNKQDTGAAHGEPLGPQEAALSKENLGWPAESPFLIPPEALERFRQAVDRGAAWEAEWESRFLAYEDAYPDLAEEFLRVMGKRLPAGWESRVPVFEQGDGPMATRIASGKVLNAIGPRLPELMGGSADLSPSTKTIMTGAGDFQPDERAGRNMHFGVREHGMGGILNGMALHGGILPYGATFLVFSDYMRPSIRLAALSKLHVIYVFTHDSIGLGEDGPTHQPVEHLLALRAIPNVTVIRPADANETAAAWKIAVSRQGGPIALALTRQNLPVIVSLKPEDIFSGVARGGYALRESGLGADPDLILVASGSEVSLALDAAGRLESEGIGVRVVSMPSWNLFREQTPAYRQGLFPADVPIAAIEAGTPLGWKPYIGETPNLEVVAIDRFGESAPGKMVMDELGFNVENVCRRARDLIEWNRGIK